jgi:hypothetical protein
MLFLLSWLFIVFQKGGFDMRLTLLTFLAMMAMVVIFFHPGSVTAETKPPAEGGVLPAIDLAVPPSTEYQQYLGITGKKSFTIPEIKAEIVLIEIFSMY